MTFSIPESWSIATIGDISDKIHYGYTEKSSLEPIGPKFLRITDIQDNYVDWKNVPFCKISDNDKYKYILNPNDIVFARTGATVGKSFLIGPNIPKSVFASYLIRIIPNPHILAKYIYLYFQSFYYWAQIIKDKAGIGQPNVNATKLAKLQIPLPPLPEQHRIIAKIEEFFTKLDAGVEALKQVQAQLKRYRQSVLKAAVEGRLTAEWRKQHKDELEPADKLLDRILKERRKKWEAEQLTTYKSQGKTPPKNWRDKYEEPTLPDTSNLPELPEGWKWASIYQLSYEIRYGSSSKTNMDTKGIPVLRMGNIVDGNLVSEKLKYLPENHNEFPDLLLDSGDLLFNRTNSVELVGKTAVYNGYPSPCSYASYLIRVRFSRGVEPYFISYFINSVYGHAWIRSVVSQQVGQANVNGTKLKNLAVPLPPFDEQKNIVTELERLFSIIFESESLIQREINRAQSLRQSILKRAFEGKLLLQNPNDEPAAVLLERIKAEKAKLKKSKQMEMS